MINKCFLAGLLLLLAACVTIRNVSSGDHLVGERLTVNIEGNWNHLDYPGLKPAQLWTMEGVTIDEFRIYSGIKDGEVIGAAASGKNDIVFRASMQIEQLVAMFEALLTRDGSTFKLSKLEPYSFGGDKGFRFAYERTRKLDNVRQLGVGFGAIDGGELFALIYQAPRLTFFSRQQARVEAIARSVVIKPRAGT